MPQSKISVVIRTLNEALYLEDLLIGIKRQVLPRGITAEVVLIDSGSTDETLNIAEKYGCIVSHISREFFSFGRSLNQGCELASGDVLVLVSGHCIPRDEEWLTKLCSPILDGLAGYVYGGQLGGKASRFSEKRIFAKYFPPESKMPQKGFYCNNANSAILKSVWELHRFDEDVTGLEDMELAKRFVNTGGKVAYIAEAAVYHLHDESWAQVKRRFEREAIALQKIMPQVHISRLDTLRYITSSVWLDTKSAISQGVLHRYMSEIILYRWSQYWGVYAGNHEHRKLSKKQKEVYFYPN